MCPQLDPISSQNDFNTIKAPRLYQYDLFTGSPIPSIEIGAAGRYSQIAMPFDDDKMFFRRHDIMILRRGWKLYIEET